MIKEAAIAAQDLSVQITSALRVQKWAQDHEGATEDKWTGKQLFPAIQQQSVEPQ